MQPQPFSPSNRLNSKSGVRHPSSMPVQQNQYSSQNQQPAQQNQYQAPAQQPAQQNSYPAQNQQSKSNPFSNRNSGSDGMRQVRCYGYKIHGGSAALEVKSDSNLKSRDENLVDENGEQNVFHTLRLEAALKVQNQKLYNWQDKVVIRLTDLELPLLIGVCFGWLQKISFSNHGVGSEKNSKGFSVEFQGGNVFFNVMQKEKPVRAIPVNLVQANHIGLLALEAYSKNFNGLDNQTVLNTISNLCNLYIAQNKSTIDNRV